MLLIWGKLVLKKEPIHNPTRLVYHEDKKGFINCICNEDFNLFSLFGLRLVFQTEQKKKGKPSTGKRGLTIFRYFFINS